jgi:uncharacterized protein
MEGDKMTDCLSVFLGTYASRKVDGNEGKIGKGACCCMGGGVAAMIMMSESDAANIPLEEIKPLPRVIENYQKNISPNLREKLGIDSICKYTPSCSEYGRLVVEKHGQLKGGLMAAKRILKCNPFSEGGYDHV